MLGTPMPEFIQLERPRRLPLLALMSAKTVSSAGNQIMALAVPWYVLETSGSPRLVGLTGFVEGSAYIISAFLGGVVVDRLGFRRASVLTDIGSGCAVALIPLLHATVGLPFWQLLLLVFVATILTTPGNAARRSMLADLTRLSGIRLERATSIDEGIGNLASLTGPLLTGVLLAVIGPAQVLWLDAASFALSAWLIGLLIPALWPRRATSGYRRELAEGLSFLRRDRIVSSIAAVGAYTNAVGTALFGVVLPVYALRVLDSAVGLGAMAAADGGGALVGTLVFGAIGHRLPRRTTLFGAFFLSAVTLAVLALTPPIAVTLLVLAFDGVMFGLIGPLMYTVYQERIPDELRGRVFAALMGVHRLAVPLGALLAGFLLGALSIESALLGIAILSLVMPASILVNPWLRSM